MNKASMNQEIMAHFNTNPPPFLPLLGAKLLQVDADLGIVEFQFEPGLQFCHSGNVVQGGFVTAMIDATMAHAAIARSKLTLSPPTLELKMSFFLPCRPETLRVQGRVLRWGKRIAFLEGELFNQNDELVAKASSTSRLVPFN